MGFYRGPKLIYDSLVLCWDFASNRSYPGTGTNVDNLGKQDYPGTVSGATWNSQGYFDFDGTNDTITTPAFDVSGGDFTVEVWINPDSTQTQYANVFDYGHTGTVGFTIQQNNTSTNTYYFYIGGVSANFTTLTAGTWNHLAITLQNTSAVGYLNGSQDLSFTATGNTDTQGQPLSIGSWWGGSESATRQRYWNGQYGLVRIHSRALNANEVQNNYDAQKNRYI